MTIAATDANPTFLARAQRQLAEDVPLAQATDVTLAFDHADGITARAPFAPNRNMHGTVFGGSLYVVAVVCGFAQTRWLLEQAGMDSSEVVIHTAEAEYHRPVRGPLRACVDACASRVHTRFLRTLAQHGRARLTLTIRIDEQGQRAFTLEARFAARIQGSPERARNTP